MESSAGVDQATMVWIIGAVCAVAIQTWLIIQYLIERMDKKIEAERQERLESERRVNAEIQSFGDKFVRRDDFNRHVDNVEKMFNNLSQTVTNLSMSITGRLDNIMTMLATKGHDTKTPGG